MQLSSYLMLVGAAVLVTHLSGTHSYTIGRSSSSKIEVHHDSKETSSAEPIDDATTSRNQTSTDDEDSSTEDDDDTVVEDSSSEEEEDNKVKRSAQFSTRNSDEFDNVSFEINNNNRQVVQQQTNPANRLPLVPLSFRNPVLVRQRDDDDDISIEVRRDRIVSTPIVTAQRVIPTQTVLGRLPVPISLRNPNFVRQLDDDDVSLEIVNRDRLVSSTPVRQAVVQQTVTSQLPALPVGFRSQIVRESDGDLSVEIVRDTSRNVAAPNQPTLLPSQVLTVNQQVSNQRTPIFARQSDERDDDISVELFGSILNENVRLPTAVRPVQTSAIRPIQLANNRQQPIQTFTQVNNNNVPIRPVTAARPQVQPSSNAVRQVAPTQPLAIASSDRLPLVPLGFRNPIFVRQRDDDFDDDDDDDISIEIRDRVVVTPVVQQTVQSIVRPVVQPINRVQPTVRPVVQSNIQPAVVRPVIQQTAQPIVRPLVQPTAQPVVRPVVQPNVQPVVRPVVQPTAQPIVRPVVRPTVQPIVRPVAQPTVQPVVRPVVQPINRPVVQPTAQPVAQPTVRPVVQPNVQPIIRPVVQQQTIQQTVQPVVQPIVRPIVSTQTTIASLGRLPVPIGFRNQIFRQSDEIDDDVSVEIRDLVFTPTATQQVNQPQVNGQVRAPITTATNNNRQQEFVITQDFDGDVSVELVNSRAPIQVQSVDNQSVQQGFSITPLRPLVPPQQPVVVAGSFVQTGLNEGQQQFNVFNDYSLEDDRDDDDDDDFFLEDQFDNVDGFRLLASDFFNPPSGNGIPSVRSIKNHRKMAKKDHDESVISLDESDFHVPAESDDWFLVKQYMDHDYSAEEMQLAKEYFWHPIKDSNKKVKTDQDKMDELKPHQPNNN